MQFQWRDQDLAVVFRWRSGRGERRVCCALASLGQPLESLARGLVNLHAALLDSAPASLAAVTVGAGPRLTSFAHGGMPLPRRKARRALPTRQTTTSRT